MTVKLLQLVGLQQNSKQPLACLLTGSPHTAEYVAPRRRSAICSGTSPLRIAFSHGSLRSRRGRLVHELSQNDMTFLADCISSYHGKNHVESHFGCLIWPASGVRERKLKPDHFLGQHGVEVLSKRDMPPTRALLRSLLAQGSSQTIPICRGVNMSALRHHEVTAIHVLSTNRTAKFVLYHLAPAHLNRH